MKKKFYSQIHEMNPLTMAVLPQLDENGYLGSLILEDDEEFIVNSAPKKMIDCNCSFFGANLSGRQAGTKVITQMTHKVPIAMDAPSGMYFFPTMSPIHAKCAWIGHSHIKDVYKAENSMAEIVFKNDQRIILDISFGSLMNQINRTAQFRYTLDSRLEKIQLLKKVSDNKQKQL